MADRRNDGKMGGRRASFGGLARRRSGGLWRGSRCRTVVRLAAKTPEGIDTDWRVSAQLSSDSQSGGWHRATPPIAGCIYKDAFPGLIAGEGIGEEAVMGAAG